MLILYKVVIFLKYAIPTAILVYSVYILTTARGGHFETEKIHGKRLLSKIESMPMNLKKLFWINLTTRNGSKLNQVS